jgi:hypothetical protein
MLNLIRRLYSTVRIKSYVGMTVDEFRNDSSTGIVARTVKRLVQKAFSTEEAFGTLTRRKCVVLEFDETMRALHDLPPEEFARLGYRLAHEPDFMKTCYVRFVLCYQHMGAVDLKIL